ncbi:MAG: WD40 repeat domain-containing protein, partial [Gemmataceae bacterium]
YRFAPPVNAVAFTPDGQAAVIAGHHEVFVMDLPSGKLRQRLRTRTTRAMAMLFLPDGQLVVAGSRPGQEGDVRTYRLPPRPSGDAPVAMLDGVNDPKILTRTWLDVEDSVLALALSADGKKLASAGCDRIIRVFDAESGKLEETIENHADWVLGISFSADGKQIYSAGRDKSAKVWDRAAKESILTFPDHQHIVYGVVGKADGSVAISIGADNQLRLWKPTGDGKQIRSSGNHHDHVFKIVRHPTLPIVFTASADRRVLSWDMDKLSQIKVFEDGTDHVTALAVNANGTQIISAGFDGLVRLWNTADAKRLGLFPAAPGLKAPMPASK